MTDDATETDLWVSALEELKGTSPQADEALDMGADALFFTQALWDLFRDQALHDAGPTPDLNLMESILDAINGELAAAVLMLNSIEGDVIGALERNADQLEKHNMQAKEEVVPSVVIKGNRRLAVRIKNTKIVMAAHERVQVRKNP